MVVVLIREIWFIDYEWQVKLIVLSINANLGLNVWLNRAEPGATGARQGVPLAWLILNGDTPQGPYHR